MTACLTYEGLTDQVGCSEGVAKAESKAKGEGCDPQVEVGLYQDTRVDPQVEVEPYQDIRADPQVEVEPYQDIHADPQVEVEPYKDTPY